MEKELKIYESKNGPVKVEVLQENGAAWLTMEQMCELFGENEVIIGGHLTSIYAALAVGLRVRSHKGQQFRIWAMGNLLEQIVNSEK